MVLFLVVVLVKVPKEAVIVFPTLFLWTSFKKQQQLKEAFHPFPSLHGAAVRSCSDKPGSTLRSAPGQGLFVVLVLKVLCLVAVGVMYIYIYI